MGLVITRFRYYPSTATSITFLPGKPVILIYNGGMNDAANLQEENEFLKQQLSEKEKIISENNTHLRNKNDYILRLEELIKQFQRKQFSSSSEKIPADQLALFNEAEDIVHEEQYDTEETISVKGHTRKQKPRIAIPEGLPREEIIHDLPESEKICPNDGAVLKKIGSDDHEQLDIIPARIKVIRHIRLKYACPCCEQHIVTAKKPKQPIEKSIASPGLLAFVATQKYADALPLYRQSEMFKRINIELDRSNLANWMMKCGDLVQPLINLLQEQLLDRPFIHMDETSLQVLNEPGKTAQAKSYMWAMGNFDTQPVVLFYYAMTRSQSVPLEYLNKDVNAIATDGYEGYQAACDQYNILRIGCWAHARRKFVDAQKLQGKGKTGKADQALALIQKLYVIEKQIKDKPSDEKQAVRQRDAKPVIEKLQKWMEKSLPHVPPQTAIGKALYYLHNQWDRLIVYLENGHYPIDNNPIENAIRPFAIGRKNWLFSTSQAGAKASANLYGLIETAKANGLNPYDYLKKVFTELPKAKNVEQVENLLPWNLR
jgi:transposase